jgi:proteasome beta subunit
LYDASEEDRGTAGPDMIRGIYPTVKAIRQSGIIDIESASIEAVYKRLIAGKQKTVKKEKE